MCSKVFSAGHMTLDQWDSGVVIVVGYSASQWDPPCPYLVKTGLANSAFSSPISSLA